MPLIDCKVPHQPPRVPPDGASSTAKVPDPAKNSGTVVPNAEKTEGINHMPMTQPEITPFIKNHIREIMPYLRKKAEEKGLKNDELMAATAIPHTTYYRMWKIGTPDEEKQKDGKPYLPDPDNVCRLCLAIGASLDEFQRVPSAETPVFLPALSGESAERVITNMWGEVQKNKEAAESLESEKSDLIDRNAELEHTIRELRAELKECRARIDQLTDALIERHDQMHSINREHCDQVSRLTATLAETQNDMIRLLRENHGK